MPTTESESKMKNVKLQPKSDEKIRSLESGGNLAPVTHGSSSGLSKDLALSLMGLIKDVNKEGVTPETVNASCNAANAIYKILRLNYDMKREGF